MGMETESLTKPTDDPSSSNPPSEDTRKMRGAIIGIAIGLVVIIILLVIGIYVLANPNITSGDVVARIRDIFIIFMALETLLMGLVLVILIIQLARLINLLQNEIKPILESTNETVNTLRGTSTFISDNLVEPVIKLNEYAAAMSQFFSLIGIAKKNKPDKVKSPVPKKVSEP